MTPTPDRWRKIESIFLINELFSITFSIFRIENNVKVVECIKLKNPFETKKSRYHEIETTSGNIHQQAQKHHPSLQQWY